MRVWFSKIDLHRSSAHTSPWLLRRGLRREGVTMMFGFDLLYLVLLAPGLLLALWAQWRMHRGFRQGKVVAAARGITGAQAAAEVLQAAGVTGVAIEPVEGFLTDHYAGRH